MKPAVCRLAETDTEAIYWEEYYNNILAGVQELYKSIQAIVPQTLNMLIFLFAGSITTLLPGTTRNAWPDVGSTSKKLAFESLYEMYEKKTLSIFIPDADKIADKRFEFLFY